MAGFAVKSAHTKSLDRMIPGADLGLLVSESHRGPPRRERCEVIAAPQGAGTPPGPGAGLMKPGSELRQADVAELNAILRRHGLDE